MATTGAWKELFDGRKWRVAEELSGELRTDGFSVRFTRGWFELPLGAAFRSRLSTNLGRRGAVLQETDAQGVKDIPGSRLAVGAGSIKRAREEYGAIW